MLRTIAAFVFQQMADLLASQNAKQFGTSRSEPGQLEGDDPVAKGRTHPVDRRVEFRTGPPDAAGG